MRPGLQQRQHARHIGINLARYQCLNGLWAGLEADQLHVDPCIPRPVLALHDKQRRRTNDRNIPHAHRCRVNTAAQTDHGGHGIKSTAYGTPQN